MDGHAARLNGPVKDIRARRRDLAGQLTAPVRAFLHTEVGSVGLLLGATLLALVWANSPWSGLYEDLWATVASVRVGEWSLSMDLAHWVNDALMALFFFVVGLEVRREFSVGELTDPRKAALPMAAALGGLLVPALIYVVLLSGTDAAHGWGVVIGTDTAFMLGALAVVGPTFSTQLRIYLLTLTVIDDIVAVSVIGLFYSDTINVGALVVMAALGVALGSLSRVSVWQGPPYVILAIALWIATYEAGLHASIAGMLGGLLVAAQSPDRSLVGQAAERFRAFRQSPDVEVGRSARRELIRAVSVNERLQAKLHPWASYLVVPLFALANAGVDLRDGVLGDALASRLTWTVVVALVVGKLIGVGVSSSLGVRAGLGSLPRGVHQRHVFGGAALSGIGFTVSLLIAGLAFDDETLRDQATVGVLIAAVVATLLGWAIFRGQSDADLPRVLDRAVDPLVDHVRGPVDAPLTLVEYGDFECPFCARATGVTRELRQRFGDRLRYVFRHLPLVDVHPHAVLAAKASLAADAQGRFWEMHDRLFEHHTELEYEDLVGHAAEIGLDVEQFLIDLDSEEIAERVRADVASAEASGARGTPTFFIGDQRHTGPHDTETLAAALERPRQDSNLRPRD